MDEMKCASRNPARYGPILRATVRPEIAKLAPSGRIQRAIASRRKLDTIGGGKFCGQVLKYEAMKAVNQSTNPAARPAPCAHRPRASSVFAHFSSSKPPA